MGSSSVATTMRAVLIGIALSEQGAQAFVAGRPHQFQVRQLTPEEAVDQRQLAVGPVAVSRAWRNEDRGAARDRPLTRDFKVVTGSGQDQRHLEEVVIVR